MRKSASKENRRFGLQDQDADSSRGFRGSNAGRKKMSASIKESISNRHSRVRRVSVIIPHDNDDDDDDDQEPETIEFTMGDPINDEETKLGRIRNKSGKLINSYPIQIIMVMLILGNAVLLGVVTIDSIKSDPDLLGALNWLDTFFLIAFTIELCFQIIYLGPYFVRHSWIAFDFVVIIFSWAFIDSSVSVLRSFRIFRVFALISKWGSLQKLVKAVATTVPQMASIWAVLGLFFYVYMVLCTGLYGDLYDEGYYPWPYFSSLDQSFVTLFQLMTLDSWHDVVRGTMDKHYASYICFYSFVSVTTFIFLNLMIAVVCEALIVLKSEEIGLAHGTDSSNPAKSAEAINNIVKDQADLIRAQKEMKKTLDAILTRL